MRTGETHFERRVNEEMRKLSDALLKIPFNDPRIAQAQGQYAGLELALTIFNETNKQDLEDVA